MSEDYEMIREKFHILYTNLLATARISLSSSLVDRLGCPFFILPRKSWCRSERPLMIVGKEPNQYGFDPISGAKRGYPWPHPSIWSLAEAMAYSNSVDALMCKYSMDIQLPHDRAAFGQAWRILETSIARDGKGDTVVANVCLCNGTWADRMASLLWQRGTLSEEIRILKPTAVVFLSGPAYDVHRHELQDEFPGLAFEEVEGRPIREFTRLKHERLPSYTVRTYHPGYSIHDRQRKWDGGGHRPAASQDVVTQATQRTHRLRKTHGK